MGQGSWARYDGVDFGAAAGGTTLSLRVFARAVPGSAVSLRLQLGSPDASGTLLATVKISGDGDGTDDEGFRIYNQTDFQQVHAAPAGVHTVFMVFAEASLPAPPPPDSSPHRYWRLLVDDADFNHSAAYTTRWDVCSVEFRATADGSGPSRSNDPSRSIASARSDVAGRVFSGIGNNCTPWDGCSGCKQQMWNSPTTGWIGYDFGASPLAVQSVRLKQFPNAYCAATPAVQYSDDRVHWTTKWRMECGSQCPNNATASEPNQGWVLSPGKDGAAVAPPAPPRLWGIVDWFSFSSTDGRDDVVL